MTKLDRVNQWLTLLANLGVALGLVFLILEVRTNTATNEIAIYQSSSQNWMALNSQVALDANFAALLEKAFAGAELSGVESRRFEGYVRQHLTHASEMLRLFDARLLPEPSIRLELGDIRQLATREPFRGVIEDIVPESRLRSLILEEDGLDRWLRSPP